ncbi:DUF3006 family protein [Natrinema sp. DC36]|uniref:DUF3006 family protein n=1 Tax=Natrinema sp. DC36 TaxID=2878680 RepID=UPI001CF08799|nr:DUF3006 family protein [Natrinema sp. DC36]
MRETHTAVLDRIVDGTTAVLLLEEDGTVVDELALAVEELPADGRHEGAVFDAIVDRDAGELLEATYREEVERDRRESTRERFDRLSERLSDEE